MSVGNITSNTWTPPLPPQPIPGTAGDPFSPASSTVASTPGSASPTAGPTNPFQQLASDIQAMLLQVQGGTAAQPAASVGSVTTAPTAIGGTIASNPEQQVVSDVQAMLAQLQNGQTSSGTTMQTATEAVSQAFASNMMQALQAYGGMPAGAVSPGLTA